MATIVASSMQGFGQRLVTATTLTGTADVFTYVESANPVLVLRNGTAGALTPIIDGDGGTTVPVAGVGNVSVASGYAVGSIAAGASVAIPLVSIREFLKGNISITGGTGLVATLLNF